MRRASCTAQQLTAHDVWRKARLAVEANRVRSARAAVEIVSPESSAQVKADGFPTRYLQARATARGKVRQELVTLALIKLAQGDPGQRRHAAGQQMERAHRPKSATGLGRDWRRRRSACRLMPSPTLAT